MNEPPLTAEDYQSVLRAGAELAQPGSQKAFTLNQTPGTAATAECDYPAPESHWWLRRRPNP